MSLLGKAATHETAAELEEHSVLVDPEFEVVTVTEVPVNDENDLDDNEANSISVAPRESLQDADIFHDTPSSIKDNVDKHSLVIQRDEAEEEHQESNINAHADRQNDSENSPEKQTLIPSIVIEDDVNAQLLQKAGPSKEPVTVCDFTKWHNKPYLGGFKHKLTGVEYFHAYGQTITPQEIQAMNRPLQFHRDCQTVITSNSKTQTLRHNNTQIVKQANKTTNHCYIATETDKIIKARPYITADAHHATLTKNAIIIQCFVRQKFAIRKVKRLLELKNERMLQMKERDKKKELLIERHKIAENERRMHPRTSKDFEILFNGLENWRIKESKRINNMKLMEPARLAALADLLDQESALLQKIDRLKVEANFENRQRSIASLLEKTSSPKQWVSATGATVSVDTPNIIRARELRDLYAALNYDLMSIDERLQILLHVKFTVKEFDCNLTRDIVELINREGDLISRGRKEESLLGLRQRLSNLFLQFIKTVEFNPEMANYSQQNHAEDRGTVYYCRGCTKYKPSTDFYLSTTMKQLGKCKSCTLKESLATQKLDDSSYGMMLKVIRLQEASKRQQKNKGFCYNAMALIQESDLRYLIDVIWSRKSVLSGNKKLEELTLTRWDATKELSPWNCILLTTSEALTHDCQPNLEDLYSTEFRQKIFQKHMVARQHFEQLPAMAEYLNEHYVEQENGKLVPREVL